MSLTKYIFIVCLFTINTYANNIGLTLFQGNCVTCHYPNQSISAPSMQIVQQRYKEAFSNKKDFVEYMSKWVANPNEQTSLMQDMIKKYELMPQLAFSIETTKDIANYIYDADFSK
jgi:cytochrome c551/c552